MEQKVPFSVANVKNCICATCPVQTGSPCVKEKQYKVRQSLGSGATPNPGDVPGLYCASGAATCEDIATRQMCICGECPIWKEHHLVNSKPLGYYCRDGKAH
jgi:hypothetical protein